MIERLVFITILLLKLCIFLPAEITISAHQNPPSLQACPKCYLFNETLPHLLKLKLYFSSFQLLCCLDQWWTNYGPQAKSVSLCLTGTRPCSFIYLLSAATFMLQWLEVEQLQQRPQGSESQKHLLSALLN